MSYYSQIEENLRRGNDAALSVLLKRYAIEVEVFQTEENSQSSVYGVESGMDETISSGIVEVLMTGDDFFGQDGASAGTFQSGFLYTKSPLITPGSTVKLLRDDVKFKEYKVGENPGIGQTKTVFSRFDISALG